MKAIILLSLIIQMNILYAKDCHDCSVNKNPELNNAIMSKVNEIKNGIETDEEKSIRNSLCADADSGNGNWKKFEKRFIAKKIVPEEYFLSRNCGNDQNFHIMFYAVKGSGFFGNDFVEDFLTYLTKREKDTGDKTIIYRLLNLTFNPETKRTLYDEFRILGRESDLISLEQIKAYGAKPYSELTPEEIEKGYYNTKDKVAKK
jgi:hypothetical protein